MSKIVFIHAADLHLDSPFAGLKNLPAFLIERLRESSFLAFQKVIDTAIFHRVDFLLLAGDLYDGENRSLRTQVRFRKEMERLREHNIPVYIIHGNHDHLDGSWIHVDLPENVHVFQAKPEVKQFQKQDGTTVNIYGYSYPKRHVSERIITMFTKQDDADYHIGMLHGNLEGYTDHSPYAPFSQRELVEKNFDYWALGHIHKRQIVLKQPPAIYPGNIQGRNRKETGEKGCYLVEINNGATDYQFIETGSIGWDSMQIKLAGDGQFDDILKKCRNYLQEVQNNEKELLLELVLEIADHANPSLFTEEFIEGILESLQDEEDETEGFVWPYRVIIENDSLLDEPLISENPFFGELFTNAADSNEIDSALGQLYNHREARRFLDPLDKEERAELASQSQTVLMRLFQRN
ncbi:DNA repair exonuclease [Peribacillus cavernae]|uniref:DNA repair exonuclease n=1 Tax=Peribacillus cavernae TaxID=1674310 RepID=A0A3S0W8J5_9BACI|nr:DNA repair exonuclease [Peribacillus cavernae]MDQ0217619.1 DNA repair exonuclease SbcCD nuclease subunit [Peribacillus cavernae]RUQ29952.1 DNA repair exonuclease [Peribacillus cavernae]